LRGKIVARLGDTDTADEDLHQAFTIAEQVGSPSLVYPIAYDLGQWYETTGKEREAVTLYVKAKTAIDQMATAVEDETLCSTLLQSALAQTINACVVRLGGS
jgi:Flp pilus assembly protein TadD